jgi:hypothetical protein
MEFSGKLWRSFWASLPFLLTPATPASAGEYRLRLGVDQYFEYTDNVDFTAQDETEATSYTLTPAVGLDGRGERWEFGLDLRTPFERFSESRLNSDNQDFQAEGTRTLERGLLGFDARILRNSTHTIDEAGLVERVANRRVMESLSANWTRRVGDRHEIKLTGSGLQVEYDSSLECTPQNVCSGTAQLNDYRYGAIQTDWTRLMTERTSTVLTLSWSRFRADLPPDRQFVGQGLPPLDLPERTSETIALQGGLTRIFSEKLSGHFIFGARYAENELPLWQQECFYVGTLCLIPIGPPFLTEQNTDDTSGQALTGIAYRGDRLELDVSLSQTLIPSGRGGLMDSKELTTELSYQLRERLILRVSAGALRNESGDSLLVVPETEPDLFLVSELDRKYYYLRPRVNWRFAEHWSLDAGIDWRSNDVLNYFNPATPLPVTFPDSNEAKAQSVFLNLSYNAEPIAVFR